MVENTTQEKLNNLRHSAAHLLAAAVLELYPGSKHTIGPSIENGFYYDFEFPEGIKITEEDFEKIEGKMSKLLKGWTNMEGREVSVDEARRVFAGNEYKLELIDEISNSGEKITLYRAGDPSTGSAGPSVLSSGSKDSGQAGSGQVFEDLCKGGHSENPSEEIGAFKLLSVAGAYWRGDEKNKMLTRIYGTAFSSKKELDEYLHLLEEAKKRDHRKLGQDLDLFVFSDVVGKGLPLWTPRGATIRRELENFIINEELKRGYQHVYTPDLASLKLYEKSGHYPYYKESMYAPIEIEGEKFMLRPMSCPHHFELFLSRPRSYRELPIRYGELANMYRYEKSGELSGLQRVRTFTLADAHIIARADQAKEELNSVLDLIDFVAKTFGLEQGKDYWYRLSLGDRTDEKKYFKDDSAWDRAEKTLREVLQSRNKPFSEAAGEAAFYGPKIDVQMRNFAGKEDTAFTVQYDFVMPKRFNLKYLNEKGLEEEPIVIHRSSIGAIERIVAFLIEHFAGAFPVWLSPEQAVIVPISDKNNEYGKKILDELLNSGLRARLDGRSDTMQSKIRDAQMQKVPYMLVVGDKEQKSGDSVSVRTRQGENLSTMAIESFIERVKQEIATHSFK